MNRRTIHSKAKSVLCPPYELLKGPRCSFSGAALKPDQRKYLRTAARPREAIPIRAVVEATSGVFPRLPVGEHQALEVKATSTTSANATFQAIFFIFLVTF